LESTLLTAKVRSSRDRPGITSARNVTFISGRAQIRTFRDPFAVFVRLKIPIFGIKLELSFVFDLSSSGVDFLLGLLIP